ncbi:hypothetical protein LXJ15735_28050 [Lacrimispora xylanolytica]
MKQYYVTYSGSLFIEAESEEDACELAAYMLILAVTLFYIGGNKK